MKCHLKQPAFTPIGFTLAELLIALAILGIIATFTIPKILDSGSNSKFNAIAKETAALVSGAYQTQKLNNGTSVSTSSTDLTPYMNYVAVITVNTTSIDGSPFNGPPGTTVDCSNSIPCLRLHNGAILMYGPTHQFRTSDTTSAIHFHLDPDGKVTNQGDSVHIYLYYNNRVTSYGKVLSNTYMNTFGPYNPNASNDPSWFSWSN